MSYYDDSSLVFIPSGYKTSKAYSVKPSDGTGDLTFTRSNSTATRVGPNGLIEKVRTNTFLYSQDFSDTTWVKERISVSSNVTTAPDGTSTADKIVENTDNNSHRARQNANSTQGLEYTLSCFLKASERTKARILAGGINAYTDFDLSTGLIIGSPTLCTASIANVGSGWYRCAITYTQTSVTSATQLHLIATLNAAGDFVYTGDGTSGIFVWGAMLETGVATDYIPTTSAAVSVGPVANVPRLDYLNSSCPRLLLEGQRVNLCVFSENLDNAVWTKVNSTVTANNTTAPDGYLGADRINEDTANNAHGVERVTSGAAGTYTFSIFIKKGTRRYAGMRAVVNGYSNRYFSLLDLDTGLIVSNNTVGTGVTWTSSVETYGNGWYRLIITGNHTSSNITLLAALSNSANPTYTAGVPYYQGIASENGYFWGAQIEAGAYATSYIPTLGAAVTRGADAASKTGISSLIGQTEGTIFLQFDNRLLTSYPNEYPLQIVGSGGHQLWLRKESGSNTFTARLIVNSSTIWTFSAIPVPNGNTKIAISYKTGNSALYLNGTQFGSTSAAAFSGSAFADLYFNLSGTANPELILNQALVFKTRLTNSQLAELTTI